jgi:hypothetical protein
MVRDYIALDTGAEPDSFGVEILSEVGNGLDEATRAARRAVAEISRERAQRRSPRPGAHGQLSWPLFPFRKGCR